MLLSVACVVIGSGQVVFGAWMWRQPGKFADRVERSGGSRENAKRNARSLAVLNVVVGLLVAAVGVGGLVFG
mgnify:CR=1 FL=1